MARSLKAYQRVAVGLVLPIVIIPPPAQCQTVYATAHDFRAAMSLPFLQKIIDRLAGMTYGARLDHFFGPNVCVSPAFYVWLEGSHLSDGAWRDLLGNRGVNIGLNTHVWARLDDSGGGCSLQPREAECNLAVSLQALTVDPSFTANCNAAGYPLFRQALPLPLPFDIEAGWTLTLKDSVSADATLHPEFVHRVADEWKSDGQERAVDIRTQITTVDMPNSNHSTRAGLHPGPFQTTSRGLGALVLDSSIGPFNGVALGQLSDLEPYLSTNVPLSPDAPLGISINSSFFGSASTDHSRNWGLFGSILPIRISGTITKEGRHFGIDVVLNEAAATFFHQGSEDLMAVRLGTTDAKVWLLNSVGPDNLLKDIEVRLVTTLPTVARDGTIALQGRELRICMELALGSAHVCLDPSGLVGMLTGLASPIAKVKQSTTIAPPDCISLTDTRVKPLHSCADTSIQNGLSYETPSKRAVLDIDLSAIRSQVSGQTVSYVLPVVLR